MTLTHSHKQDTLRENLTAIVVNLDVLTEKDKQYIKENLVQISKGEKSKYSSKVIAKKLKAMLDKQTIDNQHGLTAEFFQAVILRNQNFEQKYSYNNLEENSAKKGFDGVFTLSGEIWLLESKSSYKQSSHNNKHKVTIDRAYKGVTELISGTKSNDPWENAVSHLNNSSSNESLMERLINLSEDYTNGRYQRVEDSNLIIGSNVIHRDISQIETNLSQVELYLSKHCAKKELVVLLNFTSPSIFLDFLGELADE